MHGFLYDYSENLAFNITVRRTFVPNTHHLLQILRCAAPCNFLMVQPYLSSIKAKAAEPRNLCRKKIRGHRKVQSTEILSFLVFQQAPFNLW